jgi:sugar lactone lactonase YvrE
VIVDATEATEQAFQLAEGPVWDAPRDRLLWVDIPGRAVHEGRLDGSRIEVTAHHSFEVMIGAVAVAADGSLLVAAQEELVVITPDGARHQGPRIVPAGSGRRMNDGKADPSGRFVVGTLALTDRSEPEALVRVEDDGEITTLDSDILLSNGLAWSADGNELYHIDTRRYTVFARSYDPETGAVGERRAHLRIEDGKPDGMAVDSENHLWIAVWGTGQVRRYAPDGGLELTVRVPASRASSVAFAGEDLKTLVITTAQGDPDEEQWGDRARPGRLFTIRSEVAGLPEAQWSGRPGPALDAG